MANVVKRTLIAAIILFFLVLMLGQVLMPIVAQDVAHEYPEVSNLVTPYLVLGIVTLACFQIAAIILCIILARSGKSVFFTSATRVLLLSMCMLCVVGSIIPAGAATHLLVAMNAGGFPVILSLTVSIVAAIGFACIAYIAARTFDKARADHEELEAVI
ncbi:DUF2975 domain-containing protein [Arcanobacterium hippocoleae]